MKYHDKNNKEIKNEDVILFSLEDEMEPTGYNKFATDVKLCFWSENEKRYIPFKENFTHTHIPEVERINHQIGKL